MNRFDNRINPPSTQEEEDSMMPTIAKTWLAIFIGGLLIGLLILGLIDILGPMFNHAEYNNFNTSPQHIQAVAQKFSDDCLQLAQAKNSTERKAIEQDINSVAATVNLNEVDMTDATRTCVNQAIYDVTH